MSVAFLINLMFYNVGHKIILVEKIKKKIMANKVRKRSRKTNTKETHPGFRFRVLGLTVLIILILFIVVAITAAILRDKNAKGEENTNTPTA